MDYTAIDAKLFQAMLKNGYETLALHYQEVNDLNVFPVNDGDTGTNMSVTLKNGLKQAQEKTERINLYTKALSEGMIYGARGNSGVLLSQIFKGISYALRNRREKMTIRDFAVSLIAGYKTAYKATVKPVEGTILTVSRIGALKAYRRYTPTMTLKEYLTALVEEMQKALDKTPDLLPILKESGVIDSGGQGLVYIFRGMLSYLTADGIALTGSLDHFDGQKTVDLSLFDEHSKLDFGYCTEFILQLSAEKIKVSDFDLDSFIAYLKEHGNSIVCFKDGTRVKVHIHTKKPYEVIEKAQEYGEFVAFKMENMALQHNGILKADQDKKEERKDLAIIAVYTGEGIKEIFSSLGVDYLLDGGVSMNTSTGEFLAAFDKVNATNIILLPNEGNLLMSANQAARLYKKSHVRVLETKTLQEGYGALSMMMRDSRTPEQVYLSLLSGMKNVDSCFIAKASRDFKANEEYHHQGEYLESLDNLLVGGNPLRKEAFKDLLCKIPAFASKETVFVFYGKHVPKEEVEELENELAEIYPDTEFGFLDGGEETYDYLLGVSK